MEKRSHTWGALEFLINYPTLKLGFKYLQIHTHIRTRNSIAGNAKHNWVKQSETRLLLCEAARALAKANNHNSFYLFGNERPPSFFLLLRTSNPPTDPPLNRNSFSNTPAKANECHPTNTQHSSLAHSTEYNGIGERFVSDSIYTHTHTHILANTVNTRNVTAGRKCAAIVTGWTDVLQVDFGMVVVTRRGETYTMCCLHSVPSAFVRWEEDGQHTFRRTTQKIDLNNGNEIPASQLIMPSKKTPQYSR